MTNIIQDRAAYYKKLNESQKTKHHVLYISPDYDCLLWENGTVLCGKDADGFNFDDSSDGKETYDVILEKDKEIDDWLSRFENYCLIPCQTDEITREELVSQFEWESFHLQGLQIALKIANQLPLEASWNSLERGSFDSKTIVVRDGSGSMYHRSGDSPINIATSLALLFAEQLGGAYKNSFITFSERPQLIQIPETCETLEQKLYFISQYDEVANTDIGKVYELLLNVAKDSNVPKDEMIERVLIVSDMEFDRCTDGVSTFDYWKQKFAEAGWELPEIVFWNVEARDAHIPVTQNEKGVKLVSGASANIFQNVLTNDLKAVTPYEFMLQILEPYKEFDFLEKAS